MIEGLKKIINPIIKSETNYILLNNYCDCFIKKTNTIKDKSNPRISKIPHTKWYVKSYSNYYQYAKIIEALNDGNLDKLNKNLKLLASTIQIIK
jgi:meiotically up-regulated gene 157 (Mug157) protein